MAQKFPQVGLRAVFELTAFNKSYTQYQRNLRDIDRQTKQTAQSVSRSGRAMGGGLASSADQLIRGSTELQRALSMQSLGIDDQVLIVETLEHAWQSLVGTGQVNIDQFDQLAASGKSYEEALQGAVVATDTVTQSLSATAIAVTAITGALAASIRLVQQSISEYNDLAEATRRLRYQTGLASEEASGWVLAMQATGLSAASSQRALTSFLDKVAETSREQALGEESTSQFAEAIEILGVDLKDNEDNLKSTSDLLNEVDAAFKRLGPGAQSASAAQALFGFSGRALLPLLLSQRVSLEDLNKIAQNYGGTLNALSQKEYEDFIKAQFQLLSALQGVFNFIANQWTPVLTEVQRIIAASISIWRSFVQITSGIEPSVRTLVDVLNALADTLEVVNLALQLGVRLAQRYRDALHPGMRVAREAAQAEEERAQAIARAATAASEARAVEKARQEAIQETIEALNEIKGQYISKLTDLEQDAARKWQDILVNRQRDAIDRGRQEAFKLIDLQAAYRDSLQAIEDDAAKRWEDILVNRQRDALLRGLRLAFRYEDLARSAERARLDAIRDAQRQEAKQREDLRRRLEDIQRDAQRKREELEREHQRRIRDIRQQFVDTAEEAARRNDAVAVARAQRQRARELRDERQRYDDERSDLERALQEKRQDVERDRQEREQDQRDELARTLQRIQENYARQREDLQRQNERERLIRAIRYQWELEDFEAARAEQLAAAEAAYNKQLDALRLAQAREQLERTIAYQRQKDDLDAAYQQRIDDLNAWYERERDELAAHLSLTGQQLEAIYAEWAQQAAQAAAEVARAAADAVASEIIRYQHLLTEAQRAQAQARPLQPGALPPPAPAPFSVGPWPPGVPVFSQAEGGVMQATSPTHVVMGDAGPETAVFLPGRVGSLNVNHNFGRVPVDFQGLPGGMNTQQVQEIVYAVVTQIAKGIQVPRV